MSLRIKTLRKNTIVGRPSVDINFITPLEKVLGVKLESSKRGRSTEIQRKNSVKK